MTQQYWKIQWENSLGKPLELNMLTLQEVGKYELGFKGEGKECKVCQM